MDYHKAASIGAKTSDTPDPIRAGMAGPALEADPHPLVVGIVLIV